MHEHDGVALRHVQLHPLDVKAHLKIRLVEREVGPEDYFCLVMAKDRPVKEQSQRRITLSEKHQVPRLRLP